MAARTPYDEVRYSNYAYAQTHPDRLATVAALHGLKPPDPRTARVLELGCGAGGNLIAMAVATPGVKALGIDLASAPVAEGNGVIAELGLDNVELRLGDVTELTGGELGEFDYVIAHGLYAWVPDPVRDAVLAACHSHLAADGLAYVSYNAHPGGHLRRLFREAGLWFGRGAGDAVARADRAQELYRFLEAARSDGDDWWAGLLKSTIAPLAQGQTYRLVHDDLGEHWEPVWLSDFVERAAGHRLAYVGDGDLAYMLPGRVPEGVARGMDELTRGDRVAREQVSDLLRCVFFHQSVLCRDSLTPADEPDADAVRGLYFAAREGAEGAEGSEAGLLAAAMALLRARLPDALGFDELRAALGADPDELADAMLEAFRGELVMPHAAPLRAAAAGAEKPLASPLARWQAQRGTEVTSLAYTTVHMEEPAARLLLALLDGTRDRAAIRAEFAERTGVRLSADDLDANLVQLGRLFLLFES
jgi:SAM-dependent methyltransferase